jgi:transcriptional antiterminator Rof (Rho-off)
MNAAYTPIDCDFYDTLEALSTLGHTCEIAYNVSDDDNSRQAQTLAIVRGRITNLYALHGEEYMIVEDIIDDVLHIRLDALLRVDADGKRYVRPTGSQTCSLAFSTEHRG